MSLLYNVLAEPEVLPLLSHLADTDPRTHALRMQEMAYLANILLAGRTYQNRRYRPAEAATATLEICLQGLEVLAEMQGVKNAGGQERLLLEYSAVSLFKLGWKARPH